MFNDKNLKINQETEIVSNKSIFFHKRVQINQLEGKTLYKKTFWLVQKCSTAICVTLTQSKHFIL